MRGQAGSRFNIKNRIFVYKKIDKKNKTVSPWDKESRSNVLCQDPHYSIENNTFGITIEWLKRRKNSSYCIKYYIQVVRTKHKHIFGEKLCMQVKQRLWNTGSFSIKNRLNALFSCLTHVKFCFVSSSPFSSLFYWK